MDEVLRLHMTVQNNRLRGERLALGFKCYEFAQLLGISNAHYGDIENLRTLPTEDMKISIAVLLVKPIDYLFPEYLMKGIKNGRFTNRTKFLDEQETKKIAEVPTPLLLCDGGMEAAENEVYAYQLRKQIDKCMSTLTARDRKVLNLRYGLDGSGSRTQREVGEALNVTASRARHIEQLALRKLRHPTRSRKLREFVE